MISIFSTVVQPNAYKFEVCILVCKYNSNGPAYNCLCQKKKQKTQTNTIFNYLWTKKHVDKDENLSFSK